MYGLFFSSFHLEVGTCDGMDVMSFVFRWKDCFNSGLVLDINININMLLVYLSKIVMIPLPFLFHFKD